MPSFHSDFRPHLLAAAFAAVVLLSAGGQAAHASCGDWLAPHVDDERLPQRFDAQPVSELPAVPTCRGPHCHSRPMEAPGAPAPQLRFHVVNWATLVDPLLLGGSCAGRHPADEDDRPVVPQFPGIYRPPRV